MHDTQYPLYPCIYMVHINAYHVPMIPMHTMTHHQCNEDKPNMGHCNALLPALIDQARYEMCSIVAPYEPSWLCHDDDDE